MLIASLALVIALVNAKLIHKSRGWTGSGRRGGIPICHDPEFCESEASAAVNDVEQPLPEVRLGADDSTSIHKEASL